MIEQWKDIPGYEGIYQASNTGNIRSVEGKITSNSRYDIRRWSSRILKPKKNKRTTGAYDLRVELWKNGAHKTLLVSRLVALTWCDGYKNEYTVNHIDGNPLNNHYENLEWISREDNIRKGYETGLYINAQRKCILKDGKEERTYVFPSLAAASRFLGHGKRYVSGRLGKKKNSAFSKEGKEYELSLF